MSDLINQKINASSISIFYRSLPYTKEISKINLFEMLFSFSKIKNRVESIINNWIDAYENIEPALNLYFSTRVGEHRYSNSKFLALAQGLETYHRRTSNDKLMDEERFQEIVQLLIEKCPDENKKWLGDRLKHGNEVSLRKRIKSILEPFKKFIGSTKQQNQLIGKIVDTRNYLTHYDPSLEHLAATGDDLQLLCFKMEAIFQLNLLQVLGFTNEEIQSFLVKNQQLREKLGIYDL